MSNLKKPVSASINPQHSKKTTAYSLLVQLLEIIRYFLAFFFELCCKLNESDLKKMPQIS